MLKNLRLTIPAKSYFLRHIGFKLSHDISEHQDAVLVQLRVQVVDLQVPLDEAQDGGNGIQNHLGIAALRGGAGVPELHDGEIQLIDPLDGVLVIGGDGVGAGGQ